MVAFKKELQKHKIEVGGFSLNVLSMRVHDVHALIIVWTLCQKDLSLSHVPNPSHDYKD